jgi:hypothetical protein
MHFKELRRLNLDYLNTLKSVLGLLRDPKSNRIDLRRRGCFAEITSANISGICETHDE